MDWRLISAGLENADNLKSRIVKDIRSSLEMGECVFSKRPTGKIQVIWYSYPADKSYVRKASIELCKRRKTVQCSLRQKKQSAELCNTSSVL